MARERTERTERNGTGNGSVPPNAEHEVPGLSIAEIRQLIKLMDTSDLEEVVIEHPDGLKLALRKPTSDVVMADDPVAGSLESAADGLDGASAGEDSSARESADETAIEIGAPLVGVYRACVKPDDKPLIRPGDTVREGQIVAAVEALNYVNEIESAASGRVKEIFVRDGQPVEYGQPLLSIEPI